MWWDLVVLEPLPHVPNNLVEESCIVHPITLKHLTSISPIGPRPIVVSFVEVVSLRDGRLRAALHMSQEAVTL